MGYRKYFTMSFDDGLEQDKKIIEILKKYGLKATFNLNSGLFGHRCRIGRVGNMGISEFPETSKIRSLLMKNHDHYRIPKDEIHQVYEGFEIATHGYAHEFLGKIPVEDMEKSISKDIEELSALAGYKVVGHAYPFGSTSAEVEQCLKAKGILYARNVKSTYEFRFPENPLNFYPTCSHMDRRIFNLIDSFVETEAQEDMMFYIWGHGYELDFGTELGSWKHFEQLCEKIAGRTDIIYCTNKEAFEEYFKKENT